MESPTDWPIQSPYLNIAKKALAQMREFLSEFGMSPSSRGQVAQRHGAFHSSASASSSAWPMSGSMRSGGAAACS